MKTDCQKRIRKTNLIKRQSTNPGMSTSKEKEKVTNMSIMIILGLYKNAILSLT